MRAFLPHLFEKRPLGDSAGSRRITATALAFAFLGLGSLVYFSVFHKTKNTLSVSEQFMSLHKAFESGGITAFQQRKEALRAQISEEMKDPDRIPATALNIATYLFPDLLPEENFEKAAARELWEPLEKSIEQNPQSPESRQRFEELRATLWNYENPSRVSPDLSSTGRQIIQIYDVISGK
jgi:hypothetical protein